jgi:indolepyruvate ferredoxin oxidoreductase beta subunit
MNYDIYLVGVGGQGVLTIGELITEAATAAGIAANFYPTKGMAQRGGFVKAQIRLGRTVTGPEIPERGADLVIAMERSEALKAVRYVRPGGDFVLYGHVWQPTAVMLGKAPYPAREAVEEQIVQSGAALHCLDPGRLPEHEGTPVPANVYLLGAALGSTRLGQILDADAVARHIESRWKRGAALNQMAFRAGLGAAA